MIKSYYHATPFHNLASIDSNGIKKGCDGVVYLTKAKDEAPRFLVVRGIKDILVVEVELDDKDVEESFDHNEAFYKCKAYMCDRDIEPDEIKDFFMYKLD